MHLKITSEEIYNLFHNKSEKINLNSIEETLFYLNDVFDLMLTKKIFINLDDKKKNDVKFLRKFFCNKSGNFSIDFICDCDIGYFYNHCQKNILNYYKFSFNFFKYFFIFCYLISMIIFWVKLIKILCKKISFIKKIIIIFTPKNIVIINLCIMSTTKFFYLLIDPLNLHKTFGHIFERILFNLNYAGLGSIFSILVIMWLGINQVYNNPRIIDKQVGTFFYLQIKLTVYFILIVIYPYYISINYYNNKEKKTSKLTFLDILTYIYFLLILFAYIWGGIILIKLKNKFNKIYYKSNNENNNQIIKKIIKNFNDEINYDSKDVFLRRNDTLLSRKIINKNKSDFINIDFLQQAFEKKFINEVNICVNNNNIFDCDNEINNNLLEFNDELIEFENEMKNLNENFTIDNFNENKNKNEINNKNNKNNNIKNIKKKNISNSNIFNLRKTSLFSFYSNEKLINENDLLISELDYENMIKTYKYSFKFLLVNLILFFFQGFTEFLYDYTPFSVFIKLILISFFELVYIFISYKLFFINNISEEYKNLKYLGEIENFFNKDKKEKMYVKFKGIQNMKIYKRLKEFIFFDESD